MFREQKGWSPYITRHSSITKLARNLHIDDYLLRQHAGWSKRSNLVEVYTHELRGDSVEDLLLAYGINLKEKNKKQIELIRKEMIGPHCPFCKMISIPDSQFCTSCHKPPSSVSYNKMMEETELTKRENLLS